MNTNIKNKIEAADTNIRDMLNGQKFTIDYFQREYRWQEKHIKLLIEDLVAAFLKSYSEEHKGPELATYQRYYLGPIVFSVDTENGKKSIIDGQQRITSITLLLIYLSHRLTSSNSDVSVKELIFSEQYFQKSFNMSDESREPCMKALFENGCYKPSDDEDETIRNMVARYEDIDNFFPDEISDKVLSFFVVWLIENVILVKIIAYSDDNAYTIFETMNDRGLNLTQTEMLKGYVLSRITNKQQRTEINVLWKQEIQKLHEFSETEDLAFFSAWFRAKYAKTIRPGKVDSENQDFENIASRFHNWFKEKHIELLRLTTSDEFYIFFKKDFPFYVCQYLRIKNAINKYDVDIPHLHYIGQWGIADSLQDTLLLASILTSDDDNLIKHKMDMVARYIETYTVRRSINFRKFSQTSIKYSMFNIIKIIRDNSIDELKKNLASELNNMTENWDGILSFGMHGQNRKFVKHLLSRISSHIDNLVGKKDYTYEFYHHPKGKQYEIEHIWANKYTEHKDEFAQEKDFDDCRNSIGALILLPQGTNQSFNSHKYEDKLCHYIKENTYVQTLHPEYYSNNPNFLNADKIKELKFKPYPHFKLNDIEERKLLVQRICKQIWSLEAFCNKRGNNGLN
jgi:uncharacterized protein with ParB-like and HNH nuclease domain